MIKKLQLQDLRNSEHFQFITDGCNIFRKFNPYSNELRRFYETLFALQQDEEKAMAIERNNVKIKEKNEADRFRDRLHSRLFNYVKSILYDETDPYFDAAQRVMNIIKSFGNPVQLSENAETAMITALCNKLEPYSRDLQDIGAQNHVDKLQEANLRFSGLENECRELATAQSLSPIRSVAAVRKQIDPVYRTAVMLLNAYLKDNTGCEEFETELNKLIDKYDALLSQRKSRKLKNGIPEIDEELQ